MSRILVVDDNDDARFLVLYCLQREGMTTSEAADGAEALQVFEAVRPLAVVTELAMPRSNGLELARAIRARGDECADVPIVVLTALPADDPLVRAVTALGGTRVLDKAAGFDQVVDAVEEFLGPAGAPRSRRGEHSRQRIRRHSVRP